MVMPEFGGPDLLVFGPGSNQAYAEYNVAAANIVVARKPASLTHEEAAAVPLAGSTPTKRW